MGKPLNLIGERFGRLVVVSCAGSRGEGRSAKRYWNCVCDCGNTITTTTQSLRKGDTRSCGCLKIDLTKERMTKHGDTGTHLHNVWKTMRRRCYDVNHNDYKWYGSRGVYVCDEWKDNYLAFKEWAENNGYREDLTIDRIDSDGAYSPDNCRWVSMKEQCNNRHSSIFYTFNGQTHTLAEWSEIYDIPYSRLYSRLHRGIDFSEAIL